jgi:phage antirepressor YoqD-like protein
MALGKLQKSMIDMGVKQLTKWMREEKNGRIDLTLKQINEWLNDNSYNFKVLVNKNDQTTVVRLECGKEEKF